MSVQVISTARRVVRTPLSDLLRGRVTGMSRPEQLLAATDLPEPAKACVRRVVKRTRLWHGERARVAQELIAHFEDGLAAGASVDDLLERFGDERQAARLIRRATRRNRPWPWHAWRCAWWSLVALLVFYVGLAIYFHAGEPTISVDYLAKLNAPARAVPESERAWPLYRAALLELGWDDEATRQRINELARYGWRPGEPKWEQMVAFLDERTEVLARVRDAAKRPSLGYTVGFTVAREDARLFASHPGGVLDPVEHRADSESHDLYAIILPHLQPLRRMAELLAADARYALTLGDSKLMVERLTTMLRIASHTGESPTFISKFTAMSIRWMTVATLRSALIEAPDTLSRDMLRELAHKLAAVDVRREFLMDEGERAWFGDLMQRIYTDNGNGDGRITPEGLETLRSLDQSIFTILKPFDSFYLSETLLDGVLGPITIELVGSRREMLEQYESTMAKFEAALARPIREHPEPTMKRFGEWSLIERLRYDPMYTLLPDLDAVRRTVETFEGMQDGVLLGIALELYRRDHGDWPAALSALAPRYIPEVPVDRITGGPLRYSVVDGRPIVYSVGVDLDDDGGRLPLDTAGKKVAPLKAVDWLTDEQRQQRDPATLPDGDWAIWPYPAEDAP